MRETTVSGETEDTQPENRLFYPALDGVRAVGFLMVFFWHYFGLPWGWSGVDLFFVLSGFLITGILYDSQSAPHRARTFYIRRTLRIFPLYYGVLLLFFIASPWAHWMWNWKWSIWPMYLGNLVSLLPYGHGTNLERMATFGLIGNFHGHVLTFALGHFWSLCAEEQFYLIWPWIVFTVRDRRRLLWISGSALPLCFAARLAGYYIFPTSVVEQGVLAHFTVFRLDSLLTGGLLALLLRGPEKDFVLRLCRWMFPVCAAVTALLIIYSSRVRYGTVPPFWVYTCSFTVFCLIYSSLIGHVIQPTLLISRAFALRPLRWAGRLSYGAYVFHDIFHHYFNSLADFTHLNRKLSLAVIGLTITYTLAWLSFTFFEKPFLNLKNRWAPPMARKSLQSEA